MGLTWLSLKQVLDGSSSFFVPWAPSEPAQRHAATAVIPQTQPVPGKYGTVVPEQAMVSTERGRSRTLPPQHSPTPAAHGNVRQGHHLCLFSNRLNKAKHLGTSSRLFCRRSGMDFFCWLCTFAKVGFFSGLRCLCSSPLLPGCFTYSEQQLAHFIRSRTALLAHHQLWREASSRPNRESQVTLPPRGAWKREDKDAA